MNPVSPIAGIGGSWDYGVVPRDSEPPTLKQMQIPVALVVGGNESIVAAVTTAGVGAQVLVAECSVANANTIAAQMRPLVMVFPEDVYAFDPQGFDALARDLRSAILRLTQDMLEVTDLEAELCRLMVEAESQRDSWTGD